jgi:hypothetical protein
MHVLVWQMYGPQAFASWCFRVKRNCQDVNEDRSSDK